MQYELKEINKESEAILVEVEGFGIWVDYRKVLDWYEWEFNKYIFCENNSNDMKTRELQEKIYEDIENFDYFMDTIFCEMEEE